MRGMTYKGASRRAQRALLAAGAGLTLAVAAAPVAQATPQDVLSSATGVCVANLNGIVNSGGVAAGSAANCPPGKPAGGDTGHKVG